MPSRCAGRGAAGSGGRGARQRGPGGGGRGRGSRGGGQGGGGWSGAGGGRWSAARGGGRRSAAMIRRMFWLTLGAVVGIAGYRRLTRAARALLPGPELLPLRGSPAIERRAIADSP